MTKHNKEGSLPRDVLALVNKIPDKLLIALFVTSCMFAVIWAFVPVQEKPVLTPTPTTQPTTQPLSELNRPSLTLPEPTSTILLDTRLTYRSVFWAMRQVENGGNANPYQIKKPYWQDACEYAGIWWSYETGVSDPSKCEYIIIAYAHKYMAHNFEMLVRLHNGGCNNWKSKAAERYWHKVRNLAYDYIDNKEYS